MADAAVENPANVVPPHLKLSSKTLTNFDSVDVLAGEGIDEYSTYKKLQRELEYINLQEEYIKDEQRCVPHVLNCQTMTELVAGVSRESWYAHKKRSSGYKVSL